ncbi:hypothetical protein [Hymenobacter norwichensis]|uniref:hypothetical protein n=1 Tax=Hymenobacter norwichensis TaxID=223903 RepID=UPI0003B7999A|nr:hypothetical protein [Hymenobacter norwichensis]
MQLLNFAIGRQNIDLEWPDDGYADLHNHYDFSQLTYVPAEARLILSWQKSSGEWAKNAAAQTLYLLFEGVGYMQVKARDPDYPLSEDACLQSICRTPTESRDEFENIYFNVDAQHSYDLTLYFQSEWGIKVNADTVRLQLES